MECAKKAGFEERGRCLTNSNPVHGNGDGERLAVDGYREPEKCIHAKCYLVMRSIYIRKQSSHGTNRTEINNSRASVWLLT